MSFLAWIVVGLIAGWLAGQIMKGGGYGVLVDIVLGVLGGILGGWIFGMRALVERLRLGVFPLVGIESRQAVEACSHIGMVWTQRLFPDYETALEKRLGLNLCRFTEQRCCLWKCQAPLVD